MTLNLRLSKEETLCAWVALRGARVPDDHLEDHAEVKRLFKKCIADDGAVSAFAKDLTLAQGLWLHQAVRQAGQAGPQGGGWPGDIAEHVPGLKRRLQTFVDVLQAKQEASERKDKKGA